MCRQTVSNAAKNLTGKAFGCVADSYLGGGHTGAMFVMLCIIKKGEASLAQFHR